VITSGVAFGTEAVARIVKTLAMYDHAFESSVANFIAISLGSSTSGQPRELIKLAIRSGESPCTFVQTTI
jgi:hypothetical protein